MWALKMEKKLVIEKIKWSHLSRIDQNERRKPMKNHKINEQKENTQNNIKLANDHVDISKQSIHDLLKERIEKNKKFIEAHKEWVSNRTKLLKH